MYIKLKALLCFIFVAFFFQAMSQSNIDTLRNFRFDQEFASPESNQTEDSWGFIFGHSDLGYNQFAEKFYFRGEGVQVQNVVAYINARAVEFSDVGNANFAIYESEGGQPGARIRQKSRDYQDLRFGHPKISDATVINFDQPVPVEDSFYVSFELSGYNPNFFGREDTIGLWVLSNGGRSSSDPEQAVPGRNVVQDVNSTGWKSVDEALNWQTHFAIAPIITFTRASSSGEQAYGRKSHLQVFQPFPNPAKEELHLKYNLQQPSQTVIQVNSVNGATKFRKNIGNQSAGTHEPTLDVSHLPAGVYLLTIYAESAMITTKVTIK